LDLPRDPGGPTIDYSLSQENDGTACSLAVGTRVRHPKFAVAWCGDARATGPGRSSPFQFERAGIKKLIAGFAPLEVL
jgi:hypothetical protein